jgi:hypothetical protein
MLSSILVDAFPVWIPLLVEMEVGLWLQDNGTRSLSLQIEGMEGAKCKVEVVSTPFRNQKAGINLQQSDPALNPLGCTAADS